MTGLVAIDVVIGLVFIYLLYSLLITLLGEFVNTHTGLRGNILKRAITRMLNDETKLGWWARLKCWILSVLRIEGEEYKNSFAEKFYQSPSLKYLSNSQPVFGVNKKPAYFSADNFSDTIIHLLRSKGEGDTDMSKIEFCLKFNTLHIQPETLNHFRNLVSDAKGNADAFKEKLKEWFVETNDRATGWFKTKNQRNLFVLGFVVALAFNVDTIAIVRLLATNSTIRNYFVEKGTEAVQPNSTLGRAVKDTIKEAELTLRYKETKNAIDSSNKVLGLGWEWKQEASFWCNSWNIGKQLSPFAMKFWGLILTAFALSLGSPFWFDLLRKLIAIRGGGVKPEEKQEERKKEIATSSTPNQPVPAQSVTNIIPPEDMVEEIFRTYYPEIKKIPGVKSVMKIGEHIQINVVDAKTEAIAKAKFSQLTLEGETIDTDVKVSGTPATQQSHEGEISNGSGNNGFGSIGCVLKNKQTNVKHILSCWHVMKGDLNYDKDDLNKIILDHKKETLASRWAGGIKGKLDFAFAQCVSSEVDNNLIKKKLDLSLLKYRPITTKDIENQIGISYYDTINGVVQKGSVYTSCPSVEIKYADKTRDVEDLLVLENEGRTISQPGNSGSIIFDKEGCALGMIIAGDNGYSYAIKLSNLMEFYDELELVS